MKEYEKKYDNTVNEYENEDDEDILFGKIDNEQPKNNINHSYWGKSIIKYDKKYE